MGKYPRIGSAQVIRPIQLGNGLFEYPVTSKIELDKTSVISKKMHCLKYQQGSHYGTVGDCCTYINHEKLFELAQFGAVVLKTPQNVIITF